MNINTQFPSEYLKADGDIPDEGNLVVTMSHVEMKSIGQGADASMKPVLYFHETEKGLVLNKTNANTIQGLYGAETDDWNGKRIALFSTEVDFQGKQTLAIRVRMKKPAAPPARQAAPAAATNDEQAPADYDPFADEKPSPAYKNAQTA